MFKMEIEIDPSDVVMTGFLIKIDKGVVEWNRTVGDSIIPAFTPLLDVRAIRRLDE
jgi:hypothetical protein